LQKERLPTTQQNSTERIKTLTKKQRSITKHIDTIQKLKMQQNINKALHFTPIEIQPNIYQN
jgi:hypothetical protein